MKTKILSAAKVGEGITKFVVDMAHKAETLHELMVQSALHAYTFGDTSLIQRLNQELQSNPDEKLKGAAITNVAGMKFWFSIFCPVSIANDGKVTLMKIDGQAYEKFVALGLKNFEAMDELVQRSGNRAFFITAGEDRPFWTLTEVLNHQKATIRLLGVKALIGNVLRLDTQLNKAIEDGNIPEASIEAARDLVAQVTALVRKFRSEHAGMILAEEEDIERMKLTMDNEVEEQVTEPVQVGGDVTEGEQEQVAEDPSKVA